ncbi:ATP-dependent RNA helicase DHX29-like isoform X1 [Ciconia boyciana]|uniref:ATP-dependent RNA helicase DHX29-like isoform X1 n=1 Tax=Ciconia boyciana TaxID=52775 RepID=UPI003BA290F9
MQPCKVVKVSFYLCSTRNGPKIYSFSSTTDSSAAANLDKSVFKVMINGNLEKRIIDVISDHKNQNDDKGVISRRLTAKKLQMPCLKALASSLKNSNRNSKILFSCVTT